MNTSENQNIEHPGILYTTGVNLFYWAFEVAIKTLGLWFFWNKGLVAQLHSIPSLTLIMCASILFIISIVARLVGNSLADTILVRGFITYQQIQIAKEMAAKHKATQEDDR